ncbi:hypothetical protein Q7W37_07350 [Streptococcus suis]|nr:hypothetical protein [Streptococcus suis]
MSSKYLDEPNLQIAMTEYNDISKGREVKDPNLPEDQVTEVTVLFRGSTGPNEVLSKPADVWNDWVENDLFLGLRVFIYMHRIYAIL